MRIAIDARLNAYRRGGIPEYTRQLVTAMAPLAREHTLVLLQHSDQERPLVAAPNVRRRTAFTPPHNRFEQWTLPLELLALRPDLLHCPDFVVPLRRSFPAVVTVHDLAFMHFPEILDDDARRYYSQVRASVHSAQAVIAVSQATRNDMVELLELPPERIDLVYEAASPAFRPLGLAPDATRTLGGHTLRAGSFGLFVSTLEPRKNLPTLLKALRICLNRQPGTPYLLAVAGSRGWHYQGIFDAVRELRLDEQVLFLDNASPEDLRWLYNACVFYANPSLYEGFGLPVLEALACGAPAIVSASSSLPELVGDPAQGAALLLPALDEQAWADAVELLWHDPDRRAALAAAGPLQAARFSWEQAARQTLAIYQRAAGLGSAVEVPSNLPPTVVAALPHLPPQPVAAPTGAHLAQLPASEARLCLRCGAPLAQGTLTGGLLWRAHEPGAEQQPAELCAWACDSCGKVELVVASKAIHTPAEVQSNLPAVAVLADGPPLPEAVSLAPTEPLVVPDSDPYITQPIPPLPQEPAEAVEGGAQITQLIPPLPQEPADTVEAEPLVELAPVDELHPHLPDQDATQAPQEASLYATQVLTLPPEQPAAPERGEPEVPLPTEPAASAAPLEPAPALRRRSSGRNPAPPKAVPTDTRANAEPPDAARRRQSRKKGR